MNSKAEKFHIKGHIQVTSLCCLQAARDGNSNLQLIISRQKWDGVLQDKEMEPPSVFSPAEFHRFPATEMIEFIWFHFCQFHESLTVELLDNINVSFTRAVLAHPSNTHFKFKVNSWLLSPFENDYVYSRGSLLASVFLKENIQPHTGVPSLSHLKADPEVLLHFRPGRKFSFQRK